MFASGKTNTLRGGLKKNEPFPNSLSNFMSSQQEERPRICLVSHTSLAKPCSTSNSVRLLSSPSTHLYSCGGMLLDVWFEECYLFKIQYTFHIPSLTRQTAADYWMELISVLPSALLPQQNCQKGHLLHLSRTRPVAPHWQGNSGQLGGGSFESLCAIS